MVFEEGEVEVRDVEGCGGVGKAGVVYMCGKGAGPLVSGWVAAAGYCIRMFILITRFPVRMARVYTQLNDCLTKTLVARTPFPPS